MYTPELNSTLRWPSFELKSVDGKTYSQNDFSSPVGTWFMFICNHCPYVKAVESRFLSLAKDAISWGIKVVAVCSNDPSDYPEDLPAALLKNWQEKKFPFPYLVDDSQTLAQEMGAVCTPDFFVFDGEKRLVYRGRLDDSWKDPQKVAHEDLREALLALKNGKSPLVNQHPAMGCSIKWK